MSRIGVLPTDMFEDIEYIEPVEALREAGHEVVHVGVGVEEGQTAKGKRKGTRVRIDKAIKDASVDKFDALLIPIDTSRNQLWSSEEAVQFVKQFMKYGKPVYTARRKSLS